MCVLIQADAYAYKAFVSDVHSLHQYVLRAQDLILFM